MCTTQFRRVLCLLGLLPIIPLAINMTLHLQCRASYQLGLYNCRLASPTLQGYNMDFFYPNWTLLVTVCSFYLWTLSNCVKGFL